MNDHLQKGTFLRKGVMLSSGANPNSADDHLKGQDSLVEQEHVCDHCFLPWAKGNSNESFHHCVLGEQKDHSRVREGRCKMILTPNKV